LLLCSSYLPLGVPNELFLQAIKEARGLLLCFLLSLLGPPLYSGEGAAPCPSPKAPRAGAKEEESRVAVDRVGGARLAGPYLPQNPNPCHLGPSGQAHGAPSPYPIRGSPRVNGLPSGRGPFKWAALLFLFKYYLININSLN
jgi:hypothetical protein